MNTLTEKLKSETEVTLERLGRKRLNITVTDEPQYNSPYELGLLGCPRFPKFIGETKRVGNDIVGHLDEEDWNKSIDQVEPTTLDLLCMEYLQSKGLFDLHTKVGLEIKQGTLTISVRSGLDKNVEVV